MPAPQNRVPVRIARGSKVNLDAALSNSDLQEGEICYAKDQNSLYVVESSTLVNATSGSGIIQVVQGIKTNTFTGVSNGTEIPVTGLSATITPNSASSKILITAQISYSSTGTTYGGWFKRGTTSIGTGDARGSRQIISIGLAYTVDANQINTFNYSYLDNPGSTSPLTYQFYIINDNGNAFYLNRSASDSDSATGKCAVSTVTLMEIAQ
jgi:hypothetical protein